MTILGTKGCFRLVAICWVLKPSNNVIYAATRWFDNISREFCVLILSLLRPVSNDIIYVRSTL